MKVAFLNHLLVILISFLLMFAGSLTFAASPNENDDPDSDIHPLMRDAGSEQIQKPSKGNKEGLSPSPQDESRKKYKWLFKEAGPQQG